jgi:hypothetical protein
MANPDFNTLTSTTIKHYTKVLEEQIFTSKPLLWILRNAGAFKSVGGTQFVTPLLVDESSNTGSYADLDVFTIVEDEPISSAEYPFRQYAGNLIIKGIDEAKNSGPEAMLSLVESKLQALQWSMAEDINTMLFGDGTGNGNKDFYGLEAVVDDGNTFGGINRATAGNAYWRSLVEDASGAALDLPTMRHVFNTVSEGSDTVTNIVTSQVQFEMYEHLLQDDRRYVDAEVGDGGFLTLSFKGVPIVFDRACPADRMYFLNTKYLHFPTVDGKWFEQSDWITPVNQDAKVKRILCYGNLVTSASRRQGVIDGLDATDPWAP